MLCLAHLCQLTVDVLWSHQRALVWLDTAVLHAYVFIIKKFFRPISINFTSIMLYEKKDKVYERCEKGVALSPGSIFTDFSKEKH